MTTSSVQTEQDKPKYPNDTPPEQIEALIEGCADLQKQILRRFAQSVLEEMRYHLWVAQEKCEVFEQTMTKQRAHAEAETKRADELAAEVERLRGKCAAIEGDEIGHPCVAYEEMQQRAHVAEAALAEAISAFERILSGIPACDSDGNLFIDYYSPDGEYVGRENVDPHAVIGSIAGVAQAAIKKAKEPK